MRFWKIVELIMAAFEGHDESTDGEDDDELSNASSSSHHTSNERYVLTIDDDCSDVHRVQQKNE